LSVSCFAGGGDADGGGLDPGDSDDGGGELSSELEAGNLEACCVSSFDCSNTEAAPGAHPVRGKGYAHLP
jgi:hypothetical protein